MIMIDDYDNDYYYFLHNNNNNGDNLQSNWKTFYLNPFLGGFGFLQLLPGV